MKNKVLKVAVGSLALSMVGLVGYQAKAEASYMDEFPYVYVVPEAMKESLAYEIRGSETEDEASLRDQFQLFTKANLATVRAMESEGEYSTLEGIQHVTNLEAYGVEGKTSVVDPRLLSKNTKMKNLEISGSFYSIDFLKNLSKLERLDLRNTSETTDEYRALLGEKDRKVRPLFDLSVLDSLNNLKSIRVQSEGFTEPVALKKSMTNYTMVSPIVLPQVFVDKGAKVIIESEDQNFTYQDDVLSWAQLSSDTKELHFSWHVEDWTYFGEATIPVLWK
ncbi:hypothetical protein A5821_002201 [Enterococcus sp. 7F3_DIV0205]|uniref:WxL domain-containing protein n=1 Tax=Candidatus Enterococcus palustris TaxID=1834189 RepID=A0AAQ3Y7T3_9ENTE|nr:hypothetical protein [Enterococcus sp. 7F3_DIV0205]OTN82640.1 hypothetical protein A5821_002551 [Enterococcus sp. 7F3_DIV0205]